MSFEVIAECVIAGNEPGAVNGVQGLIDAGTDPLSIINDGLMPGMMVVGERFKAGDMFVPEVLMAARAMNSGIALVKPLINDEDMPNVGTVVIGTVKGDLHDIGKNLVAMMMESAGFKVINLGVDATTDKFVEAVKENNAKIVAMSAMLTTTMVYMKKVIEALEEAGVRDQVKVMIGGAPVTTKFADEIGADLYTVDASSAADEGKNLVA
ncbi:5-methyltetrahydrofolate--homocysteine methyltransferase [Dethiosulfatibacter aminovorans DSM 17477]|uniref:5-methyltetrahydrofolate--homocysteine methyltransferase n=1 Tax=Dethiosulfatibacter aminovorans DSM 17477 TaxID=1121476 RepID=A0A1M6HZP6_9FIRM|nr:corrinoid protein [Dethiosulfatibacter aminovorans]SHJ27544.1 5-methyltetrahydrofolate--homocysteine methyltransferase [Dethiosulfatibacter aminovorans DSM 17477]